MSLYPLGVVLMTGVTRLLYKTKITGGEKLKHEGGFILASNHVSDYDPIFLSLGAYKAKRKVNYMAKAELLKIPLVGLLLKALGAFPVKRGKSDRGAIEKAISLVEEGKILGIFPEGTRSKTGELLPYKSGAAVVAARTHCDVVPVSIQAEGGKLRFRSRVIVRFGELIPYSELKLSEDFTTQELRNAAAYIREKTLRLREQSSS